ncbi:D-alanyl-D-alanine carboxypeptidase family protein [Aurantimonas sp. VKM B-3413]|uniref:D-alanyl-D-alanine carboxypeptidase family protein n=1 Tax=Aurantimonas sp. VKM B-3413 TaxID=2779401 RepID=UPI001E370D68|nr:D-alanyl-D-alanine carboxypeptidase family protein [Aurantimonas sp. VKM B-3413]MCB8838796.1 D-alanyl-D-alanine carboxypeptidase [Aurantimonas sp. VKM B-3413]
MPTLPIARRPLAVSLKALVSGLMVLLLVGCQSAQLTSAGLTPLGGASSVSVDLGPAEVRAPATLVMDYASGRTLYEDQADGLRYPASLTKMMTLYLLFETIERGKLSPDSGLVVSENAASKPPSKLGVKPGETLPVRIAMQALAVKSANDVATVVAENLAGSEAAFANAMTAKAIQLGMRHTRFTTPSGLPDPRNVSTARDLALLARALFSRFPQYHYLYGMTEYQYGGRTYRATNHLLGKVPGVDGLKTGYINDSGSNLAATCIRDGKRIIVVVLGGRTARERDAKVTALIDQYLGPAPQPLGEGVAMTFSPVGGPVGGYDTGDGE